MPCLTLLIANVFAIRAVGANVRFMFTQETAAKAGRKQRTSPVRDLLALQSLLLADAKDEKTTPAARASAARAWDVLEARKMILRGLGTPRPVEARNQPGKDIAAYNRAGSEDAPVGFLIA